MKTSLLFLSSLLALACALPPRVAAVPTPASGDEPSVTFNQWPTNIPFEIPPGLGVPGLPQTIDPSPSGTPFEIPPGLVVPGVPGTIEPSPSNIPFEIPPGLGFPSRPRITASANSQNLA